MARLRLAAAALALLTLMIAALLWLNHLPDLPLLAPAAGAVALAMVAPIVADRPARRHRVLWAAVFYVVATGAGAAAALAADTRITLVAPIGALTGAGVVLAICAYRARNRRRGKAWGDYYDR